MATLTVALVDKADGLPHLSSPQQTKSIYWKRGHELLVTDDALRASHFLSGGLCCRIYRHL